MIFSYNGFVGEDDWFDFDHYQKLGLQNAPAGFAGQFLYLNWNDKVNRNLVDIEIYKTLYDIDTALGVEPTGQLHNCLQESNSLLIYLTVMKIYKIIMI